MVLLVASWSDFDLSSHWESFQEFYIGPSFHAEVWFLCWGLHLQYVSYIVNFLHIHTSIYKPYLSGFCSEQIQIQFLTHFFYLAHTCWLVLSRIQRYRGVVKQLTRWLSTSTTQVLNRLWLVCWTVFNRSIIFDTSDPLDLRHNKYGPQFSAAKFDKFCGSLRLHRWNFAAHRVNTGEILRLD